MQFAGDCRVARTYQLPMGLGATVVLNLYWISVTTILVVHDASTDAPQFRSITTTGRAGLADYPKAPRPRLPPTPVCPEPLRMTLAALFSSRMLQEGNIAHNLAPFGELNPLITHW